MLIWVKQLFYYVNRLCNCSEVSYKYTENVHMKNWYICLKRDWIKVLFEVVLTSNHNLF